MKSMCWNQNVVGLMITCPDKMPFRITGGFKIGLAQAVVGQSNTKASLPD